MFDVCVIGSINLDLVAHASRLPAAGETVLGTAYAEHAGGKGLNQAVAAARAGASTALVGAVGDDDAGNRLVAVARADGIDADAVRITPGHPTGRALIAVDPRAENSIVVVPGANATVAADALPPSRIVLAQLEIPVASVVAAFRAARAAGGRTILNPAPAATLPAELLGACDVIVPNEHEVGLVGGVAALHDHGVEVVIVTRGAAGVDVSVRAPDGTDDTWHQPPFPVEPVDTTGAGDAFCGALAAALASGGHLRDAVRRASAAGALATTASGAVPSLPHAAAIDDLIG